MPRPPSDAVQVAIRIPKEWLEEADRIAKLVSPPGSPVLRSNGLRAIFARGLEAFREDEEAEKKRPAKRSK